MIKNFLILVTVFSIASAVYSQYQVSCPYLVDPELAIGYVDSCAEFWLNAYDEEYGGFYTNIDRYGSVLWSWGSEKNMLTQSRDAYGFVRAYMLTGDELYLEMAGEALEFMYNSAWDSLYGGWFSEINRYGSPTNPNGVKSAFDQHYALLGIASHYEATLDTTDWNFLLAGYDHNEQYYWDDRTGFEGYYDFAYRDGSGAQDKSFNATVDAITTYMLYLYLMTEDEVYLNRLEELAEQIIDHLYASMSTQAIGFVEEYDSDWNWNNAETMTIMGHVLKAGWCLGRIFQVVPDSALIAPALAMISDVWDNGYDHEYGGPYKDYNRVTGEMLLWGLQDSTKAWWQMEQAVTAGLELYDLTGDSICIQMADESLDFFMEYFVDREYGEVYSDRTRYGAQAWGLEKGNGYKAGYHSIETGYYTYLYGKLFYHHQPVTLHYKIEPMEYDRSVFMTPLAIESSRLRIQTVLLEGVVYSDYEPDERILNIPAGITGHFEVTYEAVYQTFVSDLPDAGIPTDHAGIKANPNPFNQSTIISFKLQTASLSDLTVYDIQGREIMKLAEGMKPAGSYKVKFDARNLSSGVYFAVLNSDSQPIIQKLLLVK